MSPLRTRTELLRARCGGMATLNQQPNSSRSSLALRCSSGLPCLLWISQLLAEARRALLHKMWAGTRRAARPTGCAVSRSMVACSGAVRFSGRGISLQRTTGRATCCSAGGGLGFAVGDWRAKSCGQFCGSGLMRGRIDRADPLGEWDEQS